MRMKVELPRAAVRREGGEVDLGEALALREGAEVQALDRVEAGELIHQLQALGVDRPHLLRLGLLYCLLHDGWPDAGH